ncbi:hypothetical protein AVEN_30316-1 [Araneus ventricosus]|uniref:Adult-specific cuticular protein ACP-20 n=1 Tax=Araneus ventricosus TaxID=182803 RepID=A0A4Y2KFE6_ARAVE|nr:hypothetical protein AVEN_30316-1 [Araneus ventricosus]
MKVIAIVLLMAGAAMAQYASHGAPVVHQVVQPAVHASSAGHAYGAHGQRASGYAAHGNAHHADRDTTLTGTRRSRTPQCKELPALQPRRPWSWQ